MKATKRFIVRFVSNGEWFAEFDSLKDAIQEIASEEDKDKLDSVYERNTYEVYDSIKGEVVYSDII
jgi:hypothetical protein